jgi:hypothetical protein
VRRSAALIARMWKIICNGQRCNEFRLGHAVQASQAGPVDVDVLADHICGDAGLAQSQCQRVRQRQSPQGSLTVAEFIGHLSSVHVPLRCRLSMALLQLRRRGRFHFIRARWLGISAASSSRLVVTVFDIAR